MARVNLADGQYRDLSKPLVEVDRQAPRGKRVAQRAARVFLWTMIVSTVALTAVFLVALLVFMMSD